MTDEEAVRIAREFYTDLCRWVRQDAPKPPTWEELTTEERAALGAVIISQVLPPMAQVIVHLADAHARQHEGVGDHDSR